MLQPILEKLDASARDLESNGNTEEAAKVAKAAASIREAVTEDLTVIDQATQTVTKQVISSLKILYFIGPASLLMFKISNFYSQTDVKELCISGTST